MDAASRIQKMLRKQNSCGGGGCQQNIPALNGRPSFSFVTYCEAQAYLKLENADEIIAFVSAVLKQSRKYCMLVGCFDDFGFDYFGVGFDTRGGAACF